MSMPSPENSTGYGTVAPASKALQGVQLLTGPTVGEQVLAVIGHAVDRPLVAAVPQPTTLVVEHVVHERRRG